MLLSFKYRLIFKPGIKIKTPTEFYGEILRVKNLTAEYCNILLEDDSLDTPWVLRLVYSRIISISDTDILISPFYW